MDPLQEEDGGSTPEALVDFCLYFACKGEDDTFRSAITGRSPE